jgi:DnaJ-class molecular chaperone
MNRRKFLAAVAGGALVSCARDEKRARRYDPHECPFCPLKKGVCRYCNGSTKCEFCNGTGKRKVSVPNLPAKGISASGYEETCPHCGGKGVCRYCGGKGTCWACDGTGKVDSWDYYSKAQKR